jgi:hypothetical protein
MAVRLALIFSLFSLVVIVVTIILPLVIRPDGLAPESLIASTHTPIRYPCRFAKSTIDFGRRSGAWEWKSMCTGPSLAATESSSTTLGCPSILVPSEKRSGLRRQTGTFKR